tara:strand:+ start:5655 stop:6128 length:474 start_codon:yes stop_codon:yes gene_type:complete
MDKQIVNLNFLDREVSLFKNARSNIEQLETDINNILEQNTKEEKHQLEKAIENYNGKVKTILESNEVKCKTDKLDQYSDIMNESIKKAFETYKKALTMIDKQPNLTLEKKAEYKKILYRKIIERFLNEDEISMFDNLINMMGNGNIMILNGNRMISR